MIPSSEIPKFDYPTTESGTPAVTAGDFDGVDIQLHFSSGEAPAVVDVPVGEPCDWPVDPPKSWDGAYDAIRAQAERPGS